MAAHPHDHEGDDPDGQQPDDGLQPLLLALGQLLVQDLEHDADGEADRQRDGDPDPHPPQRVPAPLLAEECRDDPDDQGGLDAFAKTDDEGGQHVSSPGRSGTLIRGP